MEGTMSSKHRLLCRSFAVGLFVAGGFACSKNGSDKTNEPPPEGLTLSEATPEHVAGTFVRDGIVVRFDATKEATLLSDADGNALYRTGPLEDGYETELLAGKLTFVYSSAFSAAMDSDDTELAESLVVTSGDGAALAELEASPEMKILPWLSKELGAADITGYGYPSSLQLHKLAQRMAQVNEIDVFAERVNDEIADGEAGEAPYCRDLRSDPNNNGCYGMCGPGCTCWRWVCFDCCWNLGCALHDRACRRCSWRRPDQCAICYSPLGAYVAIKGCS